MILLTQTKRRKHYWVCYPNLHIFGNEWTNKTSSSKAVC